MQMLHCKAMVGKLTKTGDAMRIVGICRYSLLGRGDWHAYCGKTDAEVEAVAKEQAKLLFAKDRMNA